MAIKSNLDDFKTLCTEIMPVGIAVGNYDAELTDANRELILKAWEKWLEKGNLFIKRFEK